MGSRVLKSPSGPITIRGWFRRSDGFAVVSIDEGLYKDVLAFLRRFSGLD